MRIIIPMAGMGKRMRPHTLTVPKPLISIAGKTIVQRLVEDIVKVCNEKVEEIAFIISPAFGKEVEKSLISIAENLSSKGTIYYQTEALGTAHALYCAKESIADNVIVAFADTLFIADFSLDSKSDSTIWVHKVADPSAFGVVKLDNENYISDFVEKPKQFVSDLAIIGIYYFKNGNALRQEIDYLIDNSITVKGEYQLTDALENLKKKGTKFSVGKVKEWLDCGNKSATVYTNTRVLNNIGNFVSKSAKLVNTTIIEPCYIGEGVVINNSVIGPFATIHSNCTIESSIISNSLIQSTTSLFSVNLTDTMIGSECVVKGEAKSLNLGDFSTIEKC
ncbi:MAG: nucleotidyltransferase [Bacteroidales bacterium]|nr:nucleotidyltransferase [Bacteroidales bacterium]